MHWLYRHYYHVHLVEGPGAGTNTTDNTEGAVDWLGTMT